MNRVYLDFNATSPLHPDVQRAMSEVSQLGPLNPSSMHAEGRRARQIWDEARQRIADALDCAAARVVITSGGTEANNLAIQGLMQIRRGPVLVSAVEHPSVLEVAESYRSLGREVIRIPVDDQGVVVLSALEELLVGDPPPALVSVMTANNETGVLQPTADIASRCEMHGVPLHCDAVQSAGKLPWPLSMEAGWLMSISGHKLEGPAGIGALVCSPDIELPPLLRGGNQQGGWRAGTEPVALAVGLATALERWQAHGSDWLERLRSGQRAFEQSLTERIPGAVILGRRAARLPHTTQAAFPGRDRQALLMGLDLAGIACSTGSACSSGSSEVSHVLRAMGVPEPVCEGALRFSWGPLTERSDLERAVEGLERLCRRPGSSAEGLAGG